MTMDDRTMAGIEIRTVLHRRYPDWALDKSTDDLTGIMLVMDAIVDLADGSKTVGGRVDRSVRPQLTEN